MYEVQIPIAEMNDFDLPRVCLLTGQTEGVEFKKIKFAWYPRWIVIFVFVALLVAAILALILTKKAKGELPFTPEAYKRWKLGSAGFVLSIILACGLFIGGAILLSEDQGAFGGLLMLLALAAPIASWFAWVRGKNLVVQKIDATTLTLKIPSQAAAEAISRHLVAGASRADLPGSAPAAGVLSP